MNVVIYDKLKKIAALEDIHKDLPETIAEPSRELLDGILSNAGLHELPNQLDSQSLWELVINDKERGLVSARYPGIDYLIKAWDAYTKQVQKVMDTKKERQAKHNSWYRGVAHWISKKHPAWPEILQIEDNDNSDYDFHSDNSQRKIRRKFVDSYNKYINVENKKRSGNTLGDLGTLVKGFGAK